MPKRYVFIGSQRSGHHAVMRWFAAQHTRKDFTHYNNCRKSKKDDTKLKGNLCNCCNFFGSIKDHTKITNNMILNFENKHIKYIEKCCQLHPICNENIKKIIVFRDHYNWIASYISKWSINRLLATNAINLWIESAEKILELASEEAENTNYDFIIYNHWCDSKSYRKQICKKYNLNFTDAKFKEISKHGNGSSFTFPKEKYNTRNYNQRCELYMNDPEYLKIVNDPKLIALTESVLLINPICD